MSACLQYDNLSEMKCRTAQDLFDRVRDKLIAREFDFDLGEHVNHTQLSAHTVAYLFNLIFSLKQLECARRGNNTKSSNAPTCHMSVDPHPVQVRVGDHRAVTLDEWRVGRAELDRACRPTNVWLCVWSSSAEPPTTVDGPSMQPHNAGAPIVVGQNRGATWSRDHVACNVSRMVGSHCRF